MFLLNVVLLTELSNLGFTRNQTGKPTLATKVRPPRRNACTLQPRERWEGEQKKQGGGAAHVAAASPPW